MLALPRRAWQLWRTNPRLFRRRLALVLRHPARGGGEILGARRRYHRVNRAYQGWLGCREHAATAGALPVEGPLLSILMPVYNTPERVLAEALESVLAQTYRTWELCVADDASTAPHVRPLLDRYAARDPRIRVVERATTGHIAAATNSALAIARGDFIALLDHDDLLAPEALAEVARVIQERPDVDFIYTDEDKLAPDGRRIEPFFKPAWSPTLLLSCNYVTHFAALRRALVLDVGGLRDAMVGSQDHDLFLRAGERARAVAHIPRVLYHWRMTPHSTAMASTAKPYAIEAAHRALGEAIERRGLAAALEPSHLNGHFVARRQIPRGARVSLIVRGRGAAWQAALHSPDYAVCDVVALDEGAGAPAVPAGIAVVPTVDDLAGDYLVWLDAGARPATPDAVARLLAALAEPGVAVAGGVTHDRRGRILQGGIVLGDGGQPAYAFAGLPTLPQHSFYLNLKDLAREVSAVHGGCAALRRETWRDLGGLAPDLPPSLAWIDLCLRAGQRGARIIFAPQAASVAGGALPLLPDVTAFAWPWHEYADPYWHPALDSRAVDGLPFRCMRDAAPRIRRATVSAPTR
ncbi:MAG TPA: glycosyltransferase [Thermomicrobiales bacterium]|nr:glycosyltransferase [Thermomicrobiales bacterium]